MLFCHAAIHLNRTNGNLQASWTFNDPNSDSEQAREIKWFKDNTEMVNLSNLTTVNSGNTVKGQIWLFKVRVYDGKYWSSWANSSSLAIQNAVPSWTSAIPNKTIYQDFATFTHVSNLGSYVSDIDNDVLNYSTSYDSSKIGCVIDESSVRLSSVSGKTGVVACTVTASDSSSSSATTFYVNITSDTQTIGNMQNMPRMMLAADGAVLSDSEEQIIEGNIETEEELPEDDEETIFEKIWGFEEQQDEEKMVKTIYGYKVNFGLVAKIFVWPALVLIMLTNKSKIVVLRKKIKEGVSTVMDYFFVED